MHVFDRWHAWWRARRDHARTRGALHRLADYLGMPRGADPHALVDAILDRVPPSATGAQHELEQVRAYLARSLSGDGRARGRSALALAIETVARHCRLRDRITSALDE